MSCTASEQSTRGVIRRIRVIGRRPWRRSLALAFASTLALPFVSGAAAQPPDTSAVAKPLADRASLEELVRALENGGLTELSVEARRSVLERTRTRLENGDFRAGDLVWIEVQGEPALTDTFDVAPGPELRLPAPAVGTLAMEGVLRTEAEAHIRDYLTQFVRDPVVRVRPLLRISVQGEVEHAGFHAVPADAIIVDAITAAGGTTANANMDELRIERAGEEIWEGDALREAMAAGRTIDDMRLRNGDQIVIGRRNEGGLQNNLRFLWVIVSLAGGIYGLSRAF
jgi:protein involved in polysaccharide export with SLBB domain